MTTEEPEAKPHVQQIGIGVVGTPEGQRLAVTVTTLLDYASAKQLADAIAQAAGGMSATRLVVATGTVTPR